MIQGNPYKRLKYREVNVSRFSLKWRGGVFR